MDFTEVYKAIKEKAFLFGANSLQIETHETLYYDESGNVKHLIIKGGSLNAESNTVFVLGGIQAEDIITIESLKSRFGKQTTTELKAKKDLKGDFLAILKKDKFRQILELIQERKWHIHFMAIHVLYYGIVDIIDSISGTEINPLLFKAELYQILKKDFVKTINHFKKYGYPNIKDTQKEEFLDGLLDMIDLRVIELSSKGFLNPLLILLKEYVKKAKRQKELPFIQKEKTNVWVKPFIQFYRQEIIQFHMKELRFDEEKQVQQELGKETIEINHRPLTNYKFIESHTDAMIQLSDYVVSIIRKYIIFLDRTATEVEADIRAFNEVQMNNFILLNSVLKDSLDYNPLFLNFTICLYTYKKFMKYINEYGK